MRKVAVTIKKHLRGILNAIVLKQTNGPAEGINSRIQRIKQRACGFRTATYFHLDGLNLHPEAMTRG